jgi:lipopolysaccharide transport system ATP-binding protein
MSHALTIENVSKCYRIQHREEQPAGRSFLQSVSDRLKGRHKQQATEPFWALRDINFTVAAGQRFAIMGRNGAGKSTLLKIISRIVSPTTGRITIDGRLASLLEVGVGFHMELTGRENIYLYGSILGMSKAYIRSRFDAIVAFAEIGTFLDTPVKRYSSGMYMRLAFSVATHMQSDILIMDEVLAVGDAAFQKKCIEKMEEISAEEGKTILFVSHSIDAVRSFCTAGIYLEGGRLQLAGPIAELEKSYAATIQRHNVFVPNTHKRIYFRNVSTRSKEVRFNDTLFLDCEIVADRHVGFCIVGLSITDNFDKIVGSAQFYSRQGLRRGINNITLSIPIDSIVPGDYRVVVAVALDEQLNNEDVVWYYPPFTILPDEANSYLFSQWNLHWGANVLAKATLI